MRVIAIALFLGVLALPDAGANAQLPAQTIQPPPAPGMPPPSGTYREPASAGIPPLDYAVRSQRPPKKRKKKRR
jgi:hypothetical protein